MKRIKGTKVQSMCREVPAVEWCWKVKFKKLVRSGGHLGPHLKSMDFMLSAVVPSEVLKRWAGWSEALLRKVPLAVMGRRD